MAGLYIHIPFCKTRCSYCDFYSSTLFELKNELIDCLCIELQREKEYIEEEKIDTIYFGGGTPSLLSYEDFDRIFAAIRKNYDINFCKEITLEANPDDLTKEYCAMLSRLPFNRISIGIQSLLDDELQLINRRHSAKDAVACVDRCVAAGIENISVDIIYGHPSQSLEKLTASLDIMLEMSVKHISAYHLSYEKGTVLHQLLENNKISAVDEDTSLRMYQILVAKLHEKGFVQYEISNFSKEGFHSKHNSSYWNDSKYLGIGPSAHSYNRSSRKWNISDIKEYIKGVSNNANIATIEQLSTSDLYNDFIITSLRTTKGASLTYLKNRHGSEFLDYCLKNAQKHLKNLLLTTEDNHLRFTQKGFILSDSVLTDLLYVE